MRTSPRFSRRRKCSGVAIPFIKKLPHRGISALPRLPFPGLLRPRKLREADSRCCGNPFALRCSSFSRRIRFAGFRREDEGRGPPTARLRKFRAAFFCHRQRQLEIPFSKGRHLVRNSQLTVSPGRGIILYYKNFIATRRFDGLQ